MRKCWIGLFALVIMLTGCQKNYAKKVDDSAKESTTMESTTMESTSMVETRNMPVIEEINPEEIDVHNYILTGKEECNELDFSVIECRLAEKGYKNCISYIKAEANVTSEQTKLLETQIFGWNNFPLEENPVTNRRKYVADSFESIYDGRFGGEKGTASGSICFSFENDKVTFEYNSPYGASPYGAMGIENIIINQVNYGNGKTMDILYCEKSQEGYDIRLEWTSKSDSKKHDSYITTYKGRKKDIVQNVRIGIDDQNEAVYCEKAHDGEKEKNIKIQMEKPFETSEKVNPLDYFFGIDTSKVNLDFKITNLAYDFENKAWLTDVDAEIKGTPEEIEEFKNLLLESGYTFTACGIEGGIIAMKRYSIEVNGESNDETSLSFYFIKDSVLFEFNSSYGRTPYGTINPANVIAKDEVNHRYVYFATSKDDEKNCELYLLTTRSGIKQYESYVEETVYDNRKRVLLESVPYSETEIKQQIEATIQEDGKVLIRQKKTDGSEVCHTFMVE